MRKLKLNEVFTKPDMVHVREIRQSTGIQDEKVHKQLDMSGTKQLVLSV